MSELGMDAVVKPMRRGGWSARGIIISVRHGLLVETQVGPREFAERDAALDWLNQAAAERSVYLGRVDVRPAASQHR